MSSEHRLGRPDIHHDWDGSRAPAVRIRPDDVVHFDLPITGESQVSETSTVDEVVWDFDTIYNLAGPVFVEGAEAGDTLEVEVLALTPGPWGWTTFMPELGLLADDFPEPFLKVFDLRGGRAATVVPGVEVPLDPFLGTMGVVTDEPGSIPRSLPTGAAETSTAAISSSAPRSSCRSGARERSSRVATRMGLRATARYASARSNARWRRRCASGSTSARSPARRSASHAPSGIQARTTGRWASTPT